MSTHYKTDVRKLTFAEGWRIIRSPKVILIWAAKVFRFPLPVDNPIPSPLPVEDQGVSIETYSPECRDYFDRAIGELRHLGFDAPFFYTLKESLSPCELAAALLRHQSGEAFASVLFCRVMGSAPPIISRTAAVVTPRLDDTFLATSDNPRHLDSPKGDEGVCLPGASPSELWQRHQTSLKQEKHKGTVRLMPNNAEMFRLANFNEQRNLEFHRARGHYVPMTKEEVDAARRSRDNIQGPLPTQIAPEQAALPNDPQGDPGAPTPPRLEEPTMDDRVVLEELRKLQEKKSGSWWSILLVLLITAVLFLGAGTLRWSWQIALLLIPILLFHELGHYLAMRLFGYRNLRMFFIPLFGAAVSGRHYNVAGWKKVVVSLMGPVPGILLGVVLGCMGIVLDIDWMVHAAYLTVFINGFNLLPVLPLDGGWVMHTVLFCRHHLLNGAFHLLAALSLMAGSHFLDTKLLLYLGLFMLFSLPISYKTGRIAGRLRAQQLPAASPDNQTIPTSTALAIAREVRQEFSKGQTPKTLAQHTLGIFESLNARPPGWLGSILLLGVHGGSLVVAVVFSLLLIVARQGNFLDFVGMAAEAPPLKYDCHQNEEWTGPNYQGETNDGFLTLVLSYSDGNTAREAFEEVILQTPDAAAVQQFGQSLLLSLPPGRDDLRSHWLEQLEQGADDAFVASTNFVPHFRISCIAVDEPVAERIEEQLEHYFELPMITGLIPPWQRDDQRSDEVRQQQERARLTYLKLTRTEGLVYTNTDYLGLQKRISQAHRRGDNETAAQLQTNLTQLSRSHGLAQREAMRANDDGVYDPQILDGFVGRSMLIDQPEDYLERITTLGRFMGQLPTHEGTPLPGSRRFAARSGYVDRNGLLLTVEWIQFEDSYHGASALLTWLCDQRCGSIQYAFEAYDLSEAFDDW